MAEKSFAATTVELPEITLVGMKVATNMEPGKSTLQVGLNVFLKTFAVIFS